MSFTWSNEIVHQRKSNNFRNARFWQHFITLNNSKISVKRKRIIVPLVQRFAQCTNHCDQVSQRTKAGELGGSLVHRIQLYLVYTFRFTWGEVVLTTLWFIGRKPCRGDGNRAVVCAFFSTWYPSCISTAFNVNRAGDIVRSQFPLWTRM